MVIEAGHISKSFGPQNVLNDVSLNIDNGERVIILGQNGAGKTTLLRCLLGQYRLDSGSVRLCGADPVTDRQTALANVAFIPQLPLRLARVVLMCTKRNTIAIVSGFQ